LAGAAFDIGVAPNGENLNGHLLDVLYDDGGGGGGASSAAACTEQAHNESALAPVLPLDAQPTIYHSH
jgi:hypothetical protein